MRIKTSELTGAPLNWAVATVMGLDIEIKYGVVHTDDDEVFMPDLDWNIVGFIIEQEGIDICTDTRGGWIATLITDWEEGTFVRGEDETPRIAALRCYVASKLGDEVEIPEELLI
jgi:hypothetical protein